MDKVRGIQYAFLLFLITAILIIEASCVRGFEQKPVSPKGNLTEKQEIGYNSTNQAKKPSFSNSDKQDMANSVAYEATKVENVRKATTIILGNTALIGIELDGDAAKQKDIDNSPEGCRIKDEVARRVEQKEKSLILVSVTADPDLVSQIKDIVMGLQQGRPLSEYWDQLGDILQKVNSRAGGLRD